MKFTKMHGLGNDFIVLEGEFGDLPALARKLCDRHTGIGADGLLLVLPSKSCDTRMRIFNSDGSEAQMCGNGIRCFAKYVRQHGIVSSDEFTVETLAGVMRPGLSAGASEVTVDMGAAEIDFLSETFSVAGREVSASLALVGVPHLVVICSSLPTDAELTTLGAALEKHERFIGGTNVDFVRVLDGESIEMRTWERGCGITLACGTGACASAAVCNALKLTGSVVTVSLVLGKLTIDLRGSSVLMTGGCEVSFTGEYTEK